jgi:4-hydroxybenzoate polyprenyltransferase
MNFAMTKSIEFLTSTQLPHGEFRTEIRQQDEAKSLWQFDSSPFSTALILNSLSFLQSDKRVQQIRDKGTKFLKGEVEDYGLWRYWSSRNPKHNLIPPDLDDTCCISQLLKSNNIEFPDNRDIILNNRTSNGLFYTWLLSTPKQNKLHSNDEWVINQEEDICCVVNANTVLYLDADEECQDAINYLIEVFHSSPEQFYSPFYNHVTPFYYALSRIIYSRHSPLDSIKEELIERILSLQKYNGSFGDELKTALAVCSLLNCGFDGDNLTSALDFLIQNQQSDGSWRRIPWYGGHADKAMYGSAELTTGFCLEALARYRDLKLQPTQQPSNVNSLCRLVRSQEWWLYKIAPLLTIAYAETLLLQLPPTTATLTTLTALLSITSVAAYGYLLNDICDIETDQKAHKPNAAAQLQPWQRLLLCLLFISTGFAAPLLTHLGTIPLALLTANYLLPTLYSVPPLRLKERGIWGILSDAAGAHLVPTLFVAATVLSQTADPPRNALIFTGVAAAHAFFVGLRGILLHQLWDRANDLNSGITTFVTQQPPETIQRWINRLVFLVELLLLSGVALLLCQSTPALTAFFAVYLLLTAVNIKTAPHPFTPSPPKNQNIIPHDLYEVWLPLALAITLAVQNPQFLIFVALTAILFYPSLKVRTMEMFQVIKAGFTPIPNPTPPTTEAPRPTPTNVAPLTPAVRQQLETEGYVVLEEFLTSDELEDLREFEQNHLFPKDIAAGGFNITAVTSDLCYRKKISDTFKIMIAPKLSKILPAYRAIFCPWFRKKANSGNNVFELHQGPYFTDESRYLSLGIWCPLTDVDADNGCLYVVKGSHRLNLQKRPYYTFTCLPYGAKELSCLNENYITLIPLKAGQAILFDRKLFHGSTSNVSSTDRVAATCLALIPGSAPLYFCYRESKEAKETEIYEVPDDFYDRYIYGEKPSGDGVTLIKTEPYTYDPLTPELIAEKLDSLHPDRAIPRLKTELTTLQTHLEQSRSQLQGELTAANEQLHKKNTELATLKEDYSQTQAELEHLREQLQQTQVDLEPTKQERDRLFDQLQNLQAAYHELQTERDRQALELEQHRTTQNQAHLAALIHKRHNANGH